MTSRRKFLEYSAAAAGVAVLPAGLWYDGFSSKPGPVKISLAQWSLHRALQRGTLQADAFPFIAKEEYDIHAVEYVNGFYKDKARDENYWKDLNSRCENEGIQSLLIMVDNEGDLGDPDDSARKKAVENHRKWIRAAKILGCHSIRVNAFGQGSREAIKAALIDGMGQLSHFGAQENINILIENHGLQSSDAPFIIDVIKAVGSSFLGTLPDFGNWCLNAEWGSTQGNKCSESYDPYKGLAAFMPYAKGVSAKSYEFNVSGEETSLDYRRLLQIVKDHDFKGYIGIEYEGSKLSEAEGIRATKALLDKTWKALN